MILEIFETVNDWENERGLGTGIKMDQMDIQKLFHNILPSGILTPKNIVPTPTPQP